MAHADQARASRELLRIHTDVPVVFELESFKYGGPLRERCYELFTELGFRSLVMEFAPTAETTAKEYRLIGSIDELRAVVDELKRAGRFALRVLPDQRAAMRAGIVGLAVSTAPHQGAIPAAPPSGHAQRTAIVGRRSARGAQTAARRPGDRENRPRPEVRRHRARAPRRPARRPLGPTRCSRATCSTPRGPAIRSRTPRSSISATKRSPKKTSAAAGPRRSAWRRFPPTRRSTSPASAPTSRCSSPIGSGRSSPPTDWIPCTAISSGRSSRCSSRSSGRASGSTPRPSPRNRSTSNASSPRGSAQIFELAGEPFNINSPKQLSEILFEKLKLPALKRTGKTRTASTAVDVLEELALGHELPRLILEWRALQKLKGTYIDALPQLVNPETGRVHTSFQPGRRRDRPLEQQRSQPAEHSDRTELGREIRRAFIADPGHVLISADYSQIELRVLAHLAEDETLIEAFRRGDDIPRSDRAEGVRRRQRPGQARAAPPRQDHQLRAAVRKDGVHARQGHRRHAAGGAGVHRRLLRRVPARAGVHRSHARRRPRLRASSRRCTGGGGWCRS